MQEKNLGSQLKRVPDEACPLMNLSVAIIT
jgi:hypothetical protein